MTTQLLEIDVPVVLAVNMTDALAESGKNNWTMQKLKEKIKKSL
jgi:Fe2+ transport system protein B